MFRLKSIIIISAAVVAVGSLSAQQYTAEESAAHRKTYHQAIAERDAGKLVAAETRAKSLLRMRPGDPYVRRLVVDIQNRRRELRQTPQWQRALQQIIVPEVNIEGASLAEVLDYIRVKAEEGSGGRGAPSFVVRSKEAGEREITLKLKNVPLSEVLRYAGDLGDVRFSYEKYAIVANDTRRAVAKSEESAKPTKPEAAADPPAIRADDEQFPGVLNFRAPSVASYTGESWRG
jgi:hypothetical protein